MMSKLHIVNPADRDRAHRFILTLGGHTTTTARFLMIWADNLEEAFEELTEWADDNAPGMLLTLSESDYRAAYDELRADGKVSAEWSELWPRCDSEQFWWVVEHAEADLSTIGHTTLENGTHIHNGDWHVWAEDPTREQIKALQKELER